MLLLGDLTLIDGITETIGGGGVPGVSLDVLYGTDVDLILVDLVARNWEQLGAHFGDEVFERLSGRRDSRRGTAEDQRRHIISALATVASRYPVIAETLRREADSDAALRQDEHFLSWAKQENRGDEGTLRAVVTKLGQADHVLDSVLDRDSWNVSDEVFKAVLTEALYSRSGLLRVGAGLAAYAQLFPADALSISALRDLESWFTEDPETREPREWDTSLAIAFGAAPPHDLPALAIRAHTRFRLGLPGLHLPLFTKPLMRRLRMDTDAIEAFTDALNSPTGIREGSPIMAASWDPIADAHPEVQPAQRTYFLAVVLRHAGALPQTATEAISNAPASPGTVVHNSFTNHEGPLRLAVLDLA
jgi:hypothetical protein